VLTSRSRRYRGSSTSESSAVRDSSFSAIFSQKSVLLIAVLLLIGGIVIGAVAQALLATQPATSYSKGLEARISQLSLDIDEGKRQLADEKQRNISSEKNIRVAGDERALELTKRISSLQKELDKANSAVRSICARLSTGNEDLPDDCRQRQRGL